MKRVAAALSLLLLAGLAASAQDWKEIVRKYGPAVGRVEIRDGTVPLAYGSCFLVDREGGLLTNAHVVRDAAGPGRRILVTFPYASASPVEYEAKIEDLAREEDLDLAFLRIGASFEVACDLYTGAEPPIMSEVLVVGFPLGKDFKATPGYIQAYQGKIEGAGRMLDLSSPVDPGNSGGPVFDKEGRVVGIVTAKLLGTNFNLAMPIQDAIDFRGAVREAVSIATEPAGARVFINGIYRGTSPLEIALPRRDASLLVEKEGYAPAERALSFKDGAKPGLSIELVPAADPDEVRLTIATKPAGARVIIDNVERGLSPLELKARKGGKLRIKLLLKGHKELYVETVLGNSSEQSLEYILKKGLF
ncbi:MAG TPA: serine protease [Spirochaetales bacterium]|nr:serine protease [Spirochaetales bacterium]HRY54566.1 serine protease [Spirochaetia bacterium]HRZ65359.1 serine protease [Spirochaetia bacterium]